MGAPTAAPPVALLVGPDDDLGRALTDRLGEHGRVVAAQGADDVEAAVAAAGGADGALRALVVRVALLPPGPFDGVDPVTWFDAVDGALLSLHRVVRAALPSLRAGGEGRVVVVGAGWDAADLPRSTAAGALHGAVVAYVKTLARELGPAGTSVNEVVVPPAAPPAGAVGADDVAAVVGLLAGPDGGAVTGQLVRCGRGGDLRP